MTVGPSDDPLRAAAFWIEAAERCAIRNEDLPVPTEAEVRVKTLFSGISRGTEHLVFKGFVPESEHERMRSPNMAGTFAFPVKYGYCAVGQVESGPQALMGQTVFCLHPHQDRFVVPATSVTRLPDRLPPGRAVLAANMETALNILWDSGALPGDRIAVFGAGVVGALVAYLASRIPGSETVLVDTNPHRASLAGQLGVAFSAPDALGGEFDVLINATAAAAALETAITSAGPEARIIEASWYGERAVRLPLGGAFHSRRLSLVSSQVGTVAAAQRARWSFARRLSKALELLLDDCLDALVSGETPFPYMHTDYARVLSAPDTLCHRIHY